MSFITFIQLRIGFSTSLELLGPENGGTRLFEEICSYFPMDTASQLQLRMGFSTPLGLLGPENGGTTLFEEICSYFPVDTASQPKSF
jgi:hypothetical protein